MAISPDMIEQEIARREALAAGQSFTSIPGEPQTRVTTDTVPNKPGFAVPLPGNLPGVAALPGLETQTPEGTYQGAQAPIPPQALDPVEAEIQRREKASAPGGQGETALQRFDQTVLSVLPPDSTLRGALTTLGRAGANFNEKLAQYLGAAPDALDEQLQRVGLRLFDKPNASANAIRKYMKDAGLDVRRTEDFAGQLGRGIFEAAVTTGAWYAALPRFLALNGIKAGSVMGEVVKKIGEFSAKHPTLFTAQNVGAATGATVAEEDIGGPVATLIGGAVGSLVPGGVRGVARAVTYPARLVGRMIQGPMAEPAPILTPGTRTGVARDFAAGEREAQLGRLETERQGAIQQAGGPFASETGAASSAFEQRLTETEQVFRQQMRNMYQPYEGLQVDPTITVNRMARLQASVQPSELQGPNFPNDWAARIRALYVRDIPAEQAPAAVPFGQPLPTPSPARIEIVPTTLGDLINLRSDLLSAAANARRGAAGTPANMKQYRYLTRLAQGVQENIDTAVQGTPAEAGVRAANQFSHHFFDLFERGVIGRTFATETGRREAGTSPESLVQKMLDTGVSRNQDAFSQVTQMADFPPIGLGQYQTLQAAESAVRSIFHKVASAAPEGAEAWFAKNRTAIGSLARLGNELETTASRLAQIHTVEKGLQRDALARFIGTDPQVAFARLFSSSDPAAEAKALMQTMRLDSDALKAFRAGVIDQMLFATQGSGTQIKGLLSQPKINRMLREVLEPEEFGRLSRIAELGARMEGGEKTLGGRWTTSGLPILGRILGAQAGTTISHMMGRGNIQTPAIVSGIMRNWVTDSLGGIPAHELVARAIMDPHWERVLLSKVPATTKEAKSFNRTVRRLISTTHAMENQANPSEGEDSNER